MEFLLFCSWFSERHTGSVLVSESLSGAVTGGVESWLLTPASFGDEFARLANFIVTFSLNDRRSNSKI